MASIAMSVLALILLVGGFSNGGEESSPLDRQQHCVYTVVDIAEDLELRMAPAQCFRTFSETILHLSNGRVRLPHGTPPSVLDSSPGWVSRIAGFTIGIHYDGYNGSGSSVSVVGSSCVGGWWNTPSWFDNKESSSYNGCYRLRHYDYPNKGGSSQSTTGVGQTDNLSTLNNRVESVSYNAS